MRFSARTLFNTILAEAGIEVVLSGIRTPRMNAIMERWVQTCRSELLDRTLIWNSTTCSTPCGSSKTTTTPTDPTKASPTPVRYTRCPRQSLIRGRSPASTYENATASASSSTSTNMPRDLHG
jgi:transposase InsO family protein